MKEKIVGLLIILISFSIPSIVLGEVNKIPIYTNTQELLKAANDYLNSEFGIENYFETENRSAKNINPEMALGKWWGNMTDTKNPLYLFVYGEPFGDKKSIAGGIRHRYLGYTMMDEEYPNMFFPDDTKLSTKYDERNWIEYPWKSVLLESASKKTLYELCQKDFRFDKAYLVKNLSKPSSYYRNSIIYGMGICYGLCLDPSVLEQKDIYEVIRDIQTPSKYPSNTKLSGDFLDIPWENYVHIIQPPTNFSWGIGRVWRQEGSYCNYLTIPLAPFIFSDNNAPTASIWVPDKVNVGESIQIRAQGEDKDNDKMTHYFAVSPEDGITGFIPSSSAEKQTIDSNVFYKAGNIDLDIPGLNIVSGTVVASALGTYTFCYMVVDENGASSIATATTQVLPVSTPTTSTSGELEVKIVKSDGLDKFSYHPQWKVDTFKNKFIEEDYTFGQLFDLGKIDRNSYPGITFSKTINWSTLDTAVKNARKYKVVVSYNWNQTTHQEWKVIGHHTVTKTIYGYDKDGNWGAIGTKDVKVDDYGWVAVNDPKPTAKINLTCTSKGKILKSIQYNIASGADATITYADKTQTDTKSFEIGVVGASVSPGAK
ncbi:Athe_2463 domain-containing protein [Acetivibrio cellulolyticus]|uniref:Athe_2463 domain-containing protein n=1 Tax=Acetivibrio cellulolyticus TaxID=35830 RepID=UPI0001E2C78C|nr:hypothetical protein [Acetivibrio cellulolyticus]